ncbi:hypothetical protein QVD17_20056 [Tagetes erecta]|uniref:PB1-like domain-containing protein n=1 Tax=Tagetes erecta TaxID=13708 RepID=A0AAD8KNF6_TARER|nr:hypothetical protein QVD17_20056 [Tagetes erecta]
MVLQMWEFRDPDDPVFDSVEVYANEPTLFSLEIHHGGEFVNKPRRKYVKGKVSYVDLVDSDTFSVHEVDGMMQELGYLPDEVMYYSYKIPDKDLDVGMKAIAGDMDVHNFLHYVQKFKLIELYIEHKVTKLKTYFQSPNQGSSVIIEEIDDSGPYYPCSRRLQLEWFEQVDEGVVSEHVNEGVVLEHVVEGVANEQVNEVVVLEQAVEGVVNEQAVEGVVNEQVVEGVVNEQSVEGFV